MRGPLLAHGQYALMTWSVILPRPRYLIQDQWPSPNGLAPESIAARENKEKCECGDITYAGSYTICVAFPHAA